MQDRNNQSSRSGRKRVQWGNSSRLDAETAFGNRPDQPKNQSSTFAESDDGSGYAGGRYGNTDTEYLPGTDTQWRRRAPREDAYTRDLNDREDNYGSFSDNGNTWGSGSNYGSTYTTSSDYGSDLSVSHYGKGPKNYQRLDTRILDDVHDALTRDHHVDASEIDVSVKDGIVTLSGKVSERKMKRLAEDCVERIQGIKDIRHEIVAPGLLENFFGGKSKTDSSIKNESKKLM